MNHPIDLVGLLQHFVSVDAVAANALRNQGAGVPQAIQAQLAEIDLSGIQRDSKVAYEEWLDRTTDDILSTLEIRNRPWGTVRKAINLFMRACICNHYLRTNYKLDEIEEYAELPLDSIVATALRQNAGRGRLPRWPGLKNLTAEEHRQFQAAAIQLADQKGIHPSVYLDNYLWLENRGQQ